MHERIVTTRARGKVLRSYAERLITRAKRSLKDERPEALLHGKREIMKTISNRDIVVKLFEDIAPRFKDRNGGYTRMIHLPERISDSSRMSIIELVDRKEGKKDRPEKDRKEKAVSEKKEEKKEKERKDQKGKWYDRFRKKKRPEYE